MSRSSSILDKSAMTLSGLCLVHCLAGSLILTGLSLTGGLLSHQVHAIGLLFALPLAAVALWRGFGVHGKILIPWLGGAGIALMAGSLLLGHGGAAEIALSVAGVTLLGSAHLWNLRAARH